MNTIKLKAALFNLREIPTSVTEEITGAVTTNLNDFNNMATNGLVIGEYIVGPE